MDCDDWPPEIVVFKVETVRNERAFPLAPFCKPIVYFDVSTKFFRHLSSLYIYSDGSESN
jgi:hypothetical protein